MPDEPLLTVSLHAADWQVIMRGVWELPMKDAAATANRLQTALAEAQKPQSAEPLKEAAE